MMQIASCRLRLSATVDMSSGTDERPTIYTIIGIVADIVVFGAGQIAEVAKTYIDAHGPDRIVGVVVDAAYKCQESFHGLPVVSWQDMDRHFLPDAVKILGPLSYRRINEFRR